MNMKALRFLCRNPGSAYYEREIARKAGISAGSANKVLKELASFDLVTAESKGNLRLYSIDLDNPLARQIKVMFSIEEIYALVKRIRDHSERIVLFGSSSEGTDTGDSDIDIFVVSKDRSRIMEIISRFNKENERQVSPIIRTMSQYLGIRNKDKAFSENISRGIELWDRNGLQI